MGRTSPSLVFARLPIPGQKSNESTAKPAYHVRNVRDGPNVTIVCSVRTVSLCEKVRVAKLFEVQVVGVVLHVVTVGHDRGQHARRGRDVIDRRKNSVHPKVLVARRGAVDLDALANLRLFARVEEVAAELQCLAVLAPDVLDVPFHDPVRAQRPEPAARAVLLRGLDVPVPLGFVLAALAHGEPLVAVWPRRYEIIMIFRSPRTSQKHHE